jgi:hypothetical protein
MTTPCGDAEVVTRNAMRSVSATSAQTPAGMARSASALEAPCLEGHDPQPAVVTGSALRGRSTSMERHREAPGCKSRLRLRPAGARHKRPRGTVDHDTVVQIGVRYGSSRCGEGKRNEHCCEQTLGRVSEEKGLYL